MSTVEFDLETDGDCDTPQTSHDLKYPNTIRFSLNNYTQSGPQEFLEQPFDEAVETIAKTLGTERKAIIATMFEPISKRHNRFDTSKEGEWVLTGTLGNQKVMYPRMGWQAKR